MCVLAACAVCALGACTTTSVMYIKFPIVAERLCAHFGSRASCCNSVEKHKMRCTRLLILNYNLQKRFKFIVLYYHYSC